MHHDRRGYLREYVIEMELVSIYPPSASFRNYVADTPHLMLPVTPCMNDRPHGAFGQLSDLVLKRMREPYNAKLRNGRGHVGSPSLPKMHIPENAGNEPCSLVLRAI